MAKNEEPMCPLFPDVACPRGEHAAEECSVRVNGEYDPVQDFKDMLVMHCAIYRAEQEKTKTNSRN